MTEITFDQIKVGDRIKTREVFRDGSIAEKEFPVKYKDHNYAGTDYIGVQSDLSYCTELTIERVAPPEPKKIGTVVEYMYGKNLTTAVLFTLRDDVKHPWTLPGGYRLTWVDILAYDPNPKIKED